MTLNVISFLLNNEKEKTCIISSSISDIIHVFSVFIKPKIYGDALNLCKMFFNSDFTCYSILVLISFMLNTSKNA